MRTTLLISLGITVLLLAACQPSLLPFYTDEDVVQIPELVGAWVEEEGGEGTWTIVANDDGSYGVTKDWEGPQEHYLLYCFQLGEQQFIDVAPVPPGTYDKEVFSGLLLPTHIVAKVQVEGDSLTLEVLDGFWVERAINEGKLVIEYDDLDGAIILTAPTKELQGMLLQNLNRDEAFTESTFTRATEPVAH